jgi:alanine racemase
VTRLIRAVIDSGALRHNLAVIRARAAGARVMAVVKANAYGHGLEQTALALPQADSFAVARLEEGVRLRERGVRAPIVLLEGVFTDEQQREAHRFDLQWVVHDALQVELLAGAGIAPPAVWIKLDTGMNRLGFRPDAFQEAYRRLCALRPGPAHIRLMTHLACADEPDGEMTRAQLARFHAAAGNLLNETSIANSAGIFGTVPVGGQWVRPGLALYGVSPFGRGTGRDLGLRPVMSLETAVIAIRSVPRGETVGYGATWRAACDSRIAIVAAGYGDGLPRNLPSGVRVRIRGVAAPLCGRVSMDMIAVDVSAPEHAQVNIGAPVVLWGEDPPVETLARAAGTIPYELLCAVSQRVPYELR